MTELSKLNTTLTFDAELEWHKCWRHGVDLNHLTDFSHFHPQPNELIVMALTSDQSNGDSSTNSNIETNRENLEKIANVPTATRSQKWILERVHHDGAAEVHYLFENALTDIGRRREAHITVSSLYCSRTHCEITVNGDTVRLINIVSRRNYYFKSKIFRLQFDFSVKSNVLPFLQMYNR